MLKSNKNNQRDKQYDKEDMKLYTAKCNTDKRKQQTMILKKNPKGV